MKFTKEQQGLIDEYRKLLTYGYQKISKVELDLNRTRVRKRVLYFMMGAMQSYSESILKLMGSDPVYDKPGESLLRSQFEIWLNMRFIYSKRSEANARLFLSDTIMSSVAYAKKHKGLWQKYPSWNLVFGTMHKPEDWDKFISDNQAILRKYQLKYGDKSVTKIPDQYSRMLEIDNYLSERGKLNEKSSSEKFYILYYPFFSHSAHSTMSGLQRYLENLSDPSNQPLLNIDSSPEDAERVLTVSHNLYFGTLRFFLQVFDSYDVKEYESFRQYSKRLLMKHPRKNSVESVTTAGSKGKEIQV